MKTLLFTAILIFSAAKAQKKDFTKQQILKHPTVIEFAKSQNSTPNEVYNFLKCAKNESHLKYFKSLPLFTSKLPIITPKHLKDHNDELWEGILSECRDNTIRKKTTTTDNHKSTNDISEQKAQIIFTNSDITKNKKITTIQHIKTTDFPKIIKKAKCIKNHYKINFKEMPIFQTKADSLFFYPTHERYFYFPPNKVANGSVDDDLGKECF